MVNSRSLLNRVGVNTINLEDRLRLHLYVFGWAEIMGTSAMLATNKRPAQLSAANWEIMLWNWGAAQARVAAPDLGQNPRQNLWSTEQRSRRGRRIYTKVRNFWVSITFTWLKFGRRGDQPTLNQYQAKPRWPRKKNKNKRYEENTNRTPFRLWLVRHY